MNITELDLKRCNNIQIYQMIKILETEEVKTKFLSDSFRMRNAIRKLKREITWRKKVQNG